MEIRLYHALIQPHFDYCCSVWDGLGENRSMKVQKLQKRAVRVITISSYDTMSTSCLLDSLHLDKLSLRRKKLKTNLTFKILKGHTPSYLQNIFSLRGTRYNFRNSEVNLNLPKPRTNFLKRSLSYSGARLWNSSPQDIRMIPLLS
jgi:hypothetical protein